MNSDNVVKAADNLRRELTQVKESARGISRQLTTLCNGVRPLEISLLRQVLEKRRESVTLQSGVTSAIRDKRKLGIGLGLAVTATILGGAVGNNKYSALNDGLSALRGTLLGFGKSEWAVSLDAELRVLPRNQISAGCSWVTLESLLQILAQPWDRSEPSSCHCFSSIADVISLIRKRPELVYLTPPGKWTIVSNSREDLPKSAGAGTAPGSDGLSKQSER